MSLGRRELLRNVGIGCLCTVPLLIPKRQAFAESVPQEATAPIPPRPPIPSLMMDSVTINLPVVHPSHGPLSAAGPSDQLRALHTLHSTGERHDLAFTMWAEARGYGELGMRAIGHVIMNRVKADTKFFGHGVSGVCRQHHQFSCWNSPNDPNRKRLHELHGEDHDNADWKAWVVADRIAAKILSGHDKDNTANSTFFHNLHVSPPWRHDMILVGVMFGHVFYRPRPTAHHSARKHRQSH